MASPELVELVPGVYGYVQPDGTWWINNTGAVVGGGEVLVVDTCATEVRTRALLSAVAEVAGDAPIRYAVNTHWHGDHTYGNSLLPASTVLFGQHRMRADLAADVIIDGCPPLWSPVPDWGAVSKRLPDVAVESSVVLHAAGRVVELHHPGYPAHTTGDLVAWLPEERVLFTGDLLFHGLTPLVMMGSVDGALRSLDWLASFSPDHVVPGHGPLITAATLDEVLGQHERYYRLVLSIAAAGRAAGKSPLEAALGADLGEFAGWSDAERLVLNLHRVYADAEDRQPDLIPAFTDAITWNGGPLPTHV